ncbi:hypothetical protein [Salinisphaera aquimarina]|uniref:Serine aminopeptidase S33 domain-containing protein n=1 Tax=Salinisphaera aquimarina TaxID=2094031 RepID=A0ABV7ESX7_9GAMM
MQPFFFGPDDALYGAYHPPTFDGSRPETAVVLCQSIGHEYMRAHRACWQFAQAAAARNAHVLRFDYPATGDSQGAAADANWRAWVDSVDQAMHWLQAYSGLNEVRIVGLRVGAMLALEAVCRAQRRQRVLLWDPVERGDRFLAGLLGEHVAYTREQNRYRATAHRYAEADTDEFLGFHLPTDVIEPLAAVDMGARLQGSAARCDIARASDSDPDDAQGLAEQIALRDGRVLELPDAAGWGDVRNQFRRLALPRSLSTLVELATA